MYTLCVQDSAHPLSKKNSAWCKKLQQDDDDDVGVRQGTATTTIVIGSIAGCLVFVVVASYIFIPVRNRRQRHKRKSSRDSTRDAMYDIRFDTALAPFRIPQEDIHHISLLVKGGYGIVFRATFQNMDVAMKQLLPAKSKDTKAISVILLCP
jgi:hypothetical protein